METDKASASFASPSQRLSNGYVLPEGTLTPNAVFVGGMDMHVNEKEIREIFSKFGEVKEVKLISFSRGASTRYGFVYFRDHINIPTLLEEEIFCNGQKLKLGPAIMKDRSYRSKASSLNGQVPLTNSCQYFYYCFCPPGVAQPAPALNGSHPYSQPYAYPSVPGAITPQMPMHYAQPYSYQYPSSPWMFNQRASLMDQDQQTASSSLSGGLKEHNFVDCGVQTAMTLL